MAMVNYQQVSVSMKPGNLVKLKQQTAIESANSHKPVFLMFILVALLPIATSAACAANNLADCATCGVGPIGAHV